MSDAFFLEISLFRKWILGFILSISIGFAQDAAPVILSSADYETRSIGDWTVHVERSLKDHARSEEALQLLETRLAEVEKLVPKTALKSLHEVHFWLSRNVAPGACYHPSDQWLKENNRVVEMTKAIEIQNVDHFIDWASTQPMMVLHELAHAWHDRVLAQGYANQEILNQFQTVEASGIYNKIRHKNGNEERHYGMTNAMEYFAECTEAYFGKNDFQPFDRAELEKFDPAGARMVEKMWGISSP